MIKIDIDMRLITDHAYQGKYEEPLAKMVCSCSDCDSGIYEGDTYYEIENSKVCDDCIHDYSKIAEL